MRRRTREGWMRQHPVAMVLYSSRQILLLMVPILRALFSLPTYGMVDGSWSEYLWVDLLAVGTMFLIGYLRYDSTRYRIEQNGIRYQSGIFLRGEAYLPFEKITVVLTERQFWFRPFGYCTVRFDTDAGGSKETEFALHLHTARAKLLLAQYQKRYPEQGAVMRKVRAKWWEIVILSLLFSDSLSGILYLSAVVSAVGDWFGTDLGAVLRESFQRLPVLSNSVSWGIPTIAAWAAYLMLVSWILSVVVHILSTLCFQVKRQGRLLSLRSGLFDRFDHLIRVDSVHRIELRQNLPAWMLNMVSVFICCSGYGKIGSKLSVLLPIGIKRRILPQFSLLLPEFTVSENRLSPNRRFRRRFLFPPIMALAVTIVIFAAAWIWLIDWRKTLLAFGIAVLLPEFWFLAIRSAAYSHTGIGVKDGMLTLRYVRGFRFYTTVVPKDKITRIGIVRSPFQNKIDACDLLINTRAEGKKHIRVPNVSYTELTDCFEDLIGRLA